MKIIETLPIMAFAGLALAAPPTQAPSVDRAGIHAGCNGATCYTSNNCDDKVGTTRCYLCCTDHCAHGCETECQDECDAIVFTSLRFFYNSRIDPHLYREPANAKVALRDQLAEAEVVPSIDMDMALLLDWFYASTDDQSIARLSLAIASTFLTEYEVDDDAREVLRDLLLFGMGDMRDWRIRRVSVNLLGETGMIQEPQVLQYVIHQAAVDPEPRFATHVVKTLGKIRD